MREKKKIITVDRCSPDDCPYCVPDSYKENNWCHGYLDPKEINPVKTFPIICPLQEAGE